MISLRPGVAVRYVVQLVKVHSVNDWGSSWSQHITTYYYNISQQYLTGLISQLISCLATQIVWFNMVQWVNNEFSRHIYGGISDGDGPKTLGHEVMKWYCFGVNLQHVSSPVRRRSESTQQTLSRNVQVLKVVSRFAPRGESHQWWGGVLHGEWPNLQSATGCLRWEAGAASPRQVSVSWYLLRGTPSSHNIYFSSFSDSCRNMSNIFL